MPWLTNVRRVIQVKGSYHHSDTMMQVMMPNLVSEMVAFVSDQQLHKWMVHMIWDALRKFPGGVLSSNEHAVIVFRMTRHNIATQQARCLLLHGAHKVCRTPLAS